MSLLAFLIAAVAFSVVKYLGAAYLVYLGIRLLTRVSGATMLGLGAYLALARREA